MNYSILFQTLVDMLGCSENNQKFQEIILSLGINLPFRRPKKDETGYLVDYDVLKQKYGFSLGVEYADTFSGTLKGKNFKEKELVFYIIQDIEKRLEFQDVLFPFDISFNLSPEDTIRVLGDYVEYDEFWNCYSWIKNNLVIILNFDDENKMSSISYRLLQDYDS